jgi:outer membrane protein assembly factor BamB
MSLQKLWPCTLSLVLVTSVPALAGNFPGFRGGDGKSVSSDRNYPVEWGPEKNVRWRVELPGRSNGSPAVWGDRVFILQPVEKENRRTVMCFNRADGNLLWQSGVTYADKESHHPDNPYCSGTPATDGERVYACFGSAGLYCYDFAGKELWRRELGKLNHMFGNAISPVIAGELVVLNYGPGEGTRLVAVDKKTGEVRWEAKPPKVDPSEQTMTGPRLSGPGMMVAIPMMTGDKDEDSALSRDEMANLADAWFDKLDPDKAGKVTKAEFPERLNAALAPPQGAPGGGPPPGKVLGGPMFELLDAGKDGAVTRQEMKETLAAWHAKWSGGKGEPVDMNQALDGLNALFPPPKGAPGGVAGFGGETGPGGSWSTPIVIRANGREEIVVSFPNRLAAYAPKTGELLWFSKGLADAVQPSPIWDEQAGVIVAPSGDMSGGKMLAVRPGGRGDVTDSHRVWHQARVKGCIGSGVFHDGRLYSIATDGFAVCNDLKTGNRLWQKRLEGNAEKGTSWSSILLADEKIFVPNQSGDVFVLRAGKEFEVIATNSVSEPTNASLAASNGDLFLRTDKALWCISGK